MKKVVLIVIIIFNGFLMAQDRFTQRLYTVYEDFKEDSLKVRRFKHADILPLIEKLRQNSLFTVNSAGSSFEGRDIFLIKAGNGDKKVFLWSQMHGDEPTATMALFDIFNFLSAEDEFDSIRTKMLNELTIYFMPMVNPDGAEIYSRRTLFNIDINRDAVRQQTPEAVVLRKTFENLKADFGFNLHDQSTLYTAGNTFKTATISFLAPASDYQKSVNGIRENAIKLIGSMYNTLNYFIPGHIAKYNDDFEPRAFGDNFQKWGTSTILIESGGWKNDTEKQFIRKLNFIALLSSFNSISSEEYLNTPAAVYEQIPFNENYLKHLLLRNLTFKQGDKTYLVDIGINHSEINKEGSNDFYYVSSVDDIGDLSIFYGYEDYDLSGYEVVPGMVYDKEFTSIEQLKDINYKALYSQGFTGVILRSSDDLIRYTDLPLYIYKSKPEQSVSLELNNKANFVIKKGDEVRMVIINGFVYDLEGAKKTIFNGLTAK